MTLAQEYQRPGLLTILGGGILLATLGLPFINIYTPFDMVLGLSAGFEYKALHLVMGFPYLLGGGIALASILPIRRPRLRKWLFVSLGTGIMGLHLWLAPLMAQDIPWYFTVYYSLLTLAGVGMLVWIFVKKPRPEVAETGGRIVCGIAVFSFFTGWISMAIVAGELDDLRYGVYISAVAAIILFIGCIQDFIMARHRVLLEKGPAS